MNGYLNKSLYLLGGLLAVLGTAPASYADDTELFYANIATTDPNQVNADPNILFVVDTSGSMDGKVVTNQWDPDKTWTGAYDSDKVYWSKGKAKAPGPGSDQWFWKSDLHCKKAYTKLRQNGRWRNKFAAWKEQDTAGGGNSGGGSDHGTEYAWLALNPLYHDRPVECKADRGDHGEGIAGAVVDASKKYIADGQGNGPWSATENYSWKKTYTLYDGNHLNYAATGGQITQTRLEIVKDVMNSLLDTLTDVNVGLMRFNSQEGGPILHEVAPIANSRASLKSSVNSFDHNGWTPLSETMFEAERYYSGETPVFGDCNNVNSGSCIDSTPNAIESGQYKSPIEYSCQQNYIVLLTDGEPTRDTSVNSAVPKLPGFQAATGQTSCTRGDLNNDNGKCLDELATYMHHHDLSPLDGDQTVTTHTIGFDVDLNVLKTTATGGGGTYQDAKDTSSLAIALNEIVMDIFDETTTFTAPSVPVNAFNRTQNLQDVYVSVFEPSSRMHWPGNLKKYRLINGEITDAHGDPAVDPDSGFFETKPPAQSFWSNAPDGDNATSGGAASKLPTWQTRKVYTNWTGTSNENLSALPNQVTRTSAITASDLGIPGTATVDAAFLAKFPGGLRQAVIDWTRGRDVWNSDDDNSVDDDRLQMGAPLHVRPVTVIYDGTAANPDAVIFTMTNDGYLHAVNSRTGVEEWSYIPRRLLGDLYSLYEDDETTDVHYGLDGDIAVYVKDDDYIPGIDPNKEQVFLIFGQRRGGDMLTALDVTDRANPKLVWEIDSTSDPALADLGQTWSTPAIGKIKDDQGNTRYVAALGGGYDDGQDATGYYEDNVGNAVYMIDITDGSVVWSAGASNAHDLVLNTSLNGDANATMKHSIPAPLQVLDLSGDGFINRMYAADTGGRIWRFDVNQQPASMSKLVEGGLLATLGAAEIGSPTAADIRRFYARPDAVPYIAQHPGETSYLSLNIGSGHRAHPLETDNSDWFFSVRDFDLFNVIKTENYPAPVTFTDLTDITDDLQPQLYSTDAGWRLKLEAGGEKMFTESLTFKGTTIFTSFSPSPPTNTCGSASSGTGTNRLYRVSVTDGSPQVDVPPNQVDKTDRFRELKQGGIAPGPVVFFTNHENDGDEPPGSEGPEGGKPEADCFVGTESGGCGFTDNFVPTYWLEDETQ